MLLIDESVSEAPTVKRIQSVDRALDILEFIAKKNHAVSLTDISNGVGLNPSTCHHILKTLMARLYVRAGDSRGDYLLGNRVALLADSVNFQDDLLTRAKPVVDVLNRETEEAVHMAVLQGDEMVTVKKREALHALRIDSGSEGKSRALHATATGKALLIGMTDSDVRRLCERNGMRQFTSKTITDVEELIKDIAETTRRGFSTDIEEFQAYVVCTGVPIFGPKNQVIASLSVSVPINRATEEHLIFVRKKVMEAGKKLSLTAFSAE